MPTTLCLIALFLFSGDEDKKAEEVCVNTIVSEMGKLEENRDPKCHATATRLINFMYGTPLTTEARVRKTELQKELITALWRKAGEDARKAGSFSVAPGHFAPHLNAALPYEQDAEGNRTITLEGKPFALGHRDLRQYSSVSYGFRAILAVQQDALFDPTLDLPPADGDAVQSLRTLVDTYTLGVLYLADRAARLSDQSQVSAEQFEKSWRALAKAGAAGALADVPKQAPTPVARKREMKGAPIDHFPVLSQVIEQKLDSYKAYNNVAVSLFMSNIKSFFARHDWPQDPAEIRRIQANFSQAMVDFSKDLLLRTQAVTDAKGEALMREPHVDVVLQEMAPFRINQFEDIIFFPNLKRQDRIVIESYDADAFRDSGVHWTFLRNALSQKGLEVYSEPDPFAAELLVEGIAQYGVLLFRLMGSEARALGSPHIDGTHVYNATSALAAKLKDYPDQPLESAGDNRLISSAGVTTKTEGGWFSDITAASGLDFVHRSADWLSRFQRSTLYGDKEARAAEGISLDSPPSFSGAGVAAEDFDGDGLPDILLLGGAGNKLFRNMGDGRFSDVTAKAGIRYRGPDGFPGEPRQPLLADLDNDGDQDIVITYVNDNHRVYSNNGNGTFTDVSDTAALGGRGSVAGAACTFDYDGDGLLDLYICYYGAYLDGARPSLIRNNKNGLPNKLFRNMGNFTFKDVTEQSGTGNSGWSQAVSHTDIDGDGRQDLIVANDFGSNAYLRNNGDGTFTDLAEAWGAADSSNSMNVGITDLNGDLVPDVYISNILIMVKDEKYVLPTAQTQMKFNPDKLATMRVIEANNLFTSKTGEGGFAGYGLSDAVGRGYTSTGWAWDADFFDFDNDGDDDLYCVNGLNEYNLYKQTTRYEDAEGQAFVVQNSARDRDANVFFVNEGGKLNNRGEASGADLLGNSRAAAYLDLEGDGDLDIVVGNYHLPATLYRNNAETLGNNHLRIKLIGDPAKKTNRDAIGARILVRFDGKTVWREVSGGIGYQSLHPKEQHVGLGKATAAEVTIRWPNGDQQVLKNLSAGKLHTIRQGQ